MNVTARARAVRPERSTLLWGAVLVNTELLLLFAYVLLSPNEIVDWLPTLVPFVWINVGLWAIVRTRPAPSSSRQRRVATLIAVGYFLVLAYFGGLIGPGQASQFTGSRVVLFSIPPGWSPAVIAITEFVSVTLIPFKAIGYVALAYLVYATVLDASGSAVSGVLGLLSCVSCTWPVIASLVTGVVGGTTAVAGAVYSQSYALSTVVFVATVALLYWRPFRFRG
ncbi:MAG: hypothetical protein ABEH35_09335 [Haloarculaceae archaeon]